MPRFAPILLLFAALLASLLLACSAMDPEEPSDSTEINENIVQIGEERYQMGVWPQPEVIYATEPLDRLQISENLTVENRSTLIESGTPAPLYIEASSGGEKLLFVRTPLKPRPGFWGPLYEIDTATGEQRLLRDSSHAVSSAVYLPGSEGEKIVYYSYGPMPDSNEDGPTPGYYLLDTTTGEDSLLVEHASPAGIEEIFNGFDVSPDAQTLLYPLQHTNFGGVTPPRVVRHNLISGTQDTLDWSFDTQFLWLRYAPEGQHLAYGGYPMQAIGNIVAGSNEIGMIDLQTGAQRILDTSPYPGESMDLFPRWSPDGRHLLYSSAEVNVPGGTIERYSLYILKNAH